MEGDYTVSVKVSGTTAQAMALVHVRTAASTSPTLSISPASASLASGSTQAFHATVSGLSNTALTWSVAEGSAGGSISSGGLYTAPTVAGTYTVTARSVADSTLSATATVTVSAASGRAQLNPSEVTLAPGGTQSFQASFSGFTGSISYSLASSGGSLQSQGSGVLAYTAPATEGDYTVTIKVSGTSVQAMALIHVRAGATTGGGSISVSPASVTLAAGSTQAFLAKVSGVSGTDVVWSLPEGSASGFLFPSGLYVAPEASGTYTLTATSTVDASLSATATVTVEDSSPARVRLTPLEVTLAPGGIQDFLAEFSGAGGSISYSLGASGGSLQAQGYGAPLLHRPR